MKLSKKTYRFFSAFTLILFLSSVLIPATLSAAGLICGMQQSLKGDQHTSACWNLDSADYADTLSENATCSFQEVCDQAISDSQTSIEAVPQLTQDYAAVLVYKDISPGVLNYSKPADFQSEPVSPKATPSIFVLNSTFLN